jgi:hypothetical protein
MTKKEIIEELKEVYKLLTMEPQKYADKINKEIGIHALTAEYSYPHMVAIASVRILKILDEEEEREEVERLLIEKWKEERP